MVTMTFTEDEKTAILERFRQCDKAVQEGVVLELTGKLMEANRQLNWLLDENPDLLEEYPYA